MYIKIYFVDLFIVLLVCSFVYVFVFLLVIWQIELFYFGTNNKQNRSIFI